MNIDWRARQARKAARRSSTPGKDKTYCHPRPEDKAMAKLSRSYRSPGYVHWCARCDQANKTGGGSR